MTEKFANNIKSLTVELFKLLNIYILQIERFLISIQIWKKFDSTRK